MSLTTTTFGGLVTFARSTTGTIVGSTGLIETVAINQPRFDYDPITLAAKGLLIEESRTNLATYSEYFDKSVWTKSSTTIVPNAALAPDGTITGSLFSKTAVGAANMMQAFTVAATSVPWTASVFVKANDLTDASLAITENLGGTVLARYTIDLNSGGPLEWTAGVSCRSENFGNGWYRLSITAQSSGAYTNVRMYVYPGKFSQATAGSIYVWGAQFEQGLFATSYITSTDIFTSRTTTGTSIGSNGLIQTAAINGARQQYNPLNLSAPSFLLLEAASTNLLLRSEEFENATWAKSGCTITANSLASPDGNVTADKIVESTTAGVSHFVSQTAAISASTSYTVSVMVKAAGRSYGRLRFADNIAFIGEAIFDLTSGVVTSTAGTGVPNIFNMGGGFYRVTLTVTTNVGGTTATISIYTRSSSTVEAYTGDGTSGLYVWGAQLEAGDYATSYIPTTTATVSRGADVSSSSTTTRAPDNASINTLAPWYNSTEGTLYVEVDSFAGTDLDNTAATFSDNTASNFISILSNQGGTNTVRTTITNGGVTQMGQLTPANSYIQDGTTYKAAIGYKANNSAFSCDKGTTFATDTTCTIPSVSKLLLGQYYAAGNRLLNGHLKKLQYYPRRLSDSELQALVA